MENVAISAPPNGGLGQPRVFISYNHEDRESANSIALELARAKIAVFIDHWEIDPADRILDRIEKELQTSDYVIVLLSPRSTASAWVRTELKYAFLRQEKEGRSFLVPVLLEECQLPIEVAEHPYHDWRRPQDRPAVIQAIVNHIQGTKPFSSRARDYLAGPDESSPYKRNVQEYGHRLLLELARYPEMEIGNNQRWLLWELFHLLLKSYPCTMKLGPLRAVGIPFHIFDRWNQTVCGITLSLHEFEQGLWMGELDLLTNNDAAGWRGSGQRKSSELRFLGRQGLLSWNSSYNPNVRSNPTEPSARRPMSEILEYLKSYWGKYDEPARQSFLFDYQRLVVPADWPKGKAVVGCAACDMSLAFPNHAQSAGDSLEGATFEFYHPFFGSLKTTQLLTTQLDFQWEGDVDLFSPQTGTYLSVA